MEVEVEVEMEPVAASLHRCFQRGYLVGSC